MTDILTVVGKMTDDMASRLEIPPLPVELASFLRTNIYTQKHSSTCGTTDTLTYMSPLPDKRH